MKNLLILILCLAAQTFAQTIDTATYEVEFKLPGLFVDGRVAQESDILFCRLSVFDQENDTLPARIRYCACGEGDPGRFEYTGGGLGSSCSVRVPTGAFYRSELVVYNKSAVPSSPLRSTITHVPGALVAVPTAEISTPGLTAKDLLESCQSNIRCESDIEINF
jgi:hypothetical protein